VGGFLFAAKKCTVGCLQIPASNSFLIMNCGNLNFKEETRRHSSFAHKIGLTGIHMNKRRWTSRKIESGGEDGKRWGESSFCFSDSDYRSLAGSA
jgi:hypothetical protein